MGAMVDAVARNGYRATTLRELVTLAGVSNTTFYELFDSKQECFLATFDAIVAVVSERIGSAYRSQTDFRDRLHAAFLAFVEIVVEEPAASALVVVDSLSLGAAGVEPRERSVSAFERMFRQSFDQAPERGEVSDVTIRAIVTGIRRIVYRCLREDRPAELRLHVEELLEWALAYQHPSKTTGVAACSIAAPAQSTLAATSGSWANSPGSWNEPPTSTRSRTELTQRERIVRAIAQVATDRGYEALSIPVISGAAGVSNQTFYENFANKEDAFVAAFDALAKLAICATATTSTAGETWIDAVRAGVRGLLEFITANRLFARLAFFELPTAGPDALDHADAVTRRFTSYLEPEALPAELGRTLPGVVIEAIGGGMWAVIQHEIAQGRIETLPDLAPDIAFLALGPLGLE